jgi:hypothetical protein
MEDRVMKIDGGCHCGYIAYEAEVDPEQTAICHCTDCQTLSGSAFRTVIPAPDHSFRILSGERGGPKSYFIRVGTIRQRDQLVPKTQIWSRSRQHWLTDIGSIRTIDKQ